MVGSVVVEVAAMVLEAVSAVEVAVAVTVVAVDNGGGDGGGCGGGVAAVGPTRSKTRYLGDARPLSRSAREHDGC